MHYFFHHLNDFSGSPRIINEKIKAYNELGEEVLIITNNDYGFIDTGFLPHKYLPYSKSNSKLIKVIRLFFWWVRASLLVMAAVRKHDTVHASTLINAPILMSARLKQAKTCIHVMEYAISPKPLKSLLRFFARNFVDYYIYLSRFLMDVDPINKYGKVQITYPAVDGIISKAGSISYRERTLHPSNKNRVCMVCSLVWYKGYRQYITLARLIPECHFVLVVNGDSHRFYDEFIVEEIPKNIDVKFNETKIQNVLSETDLLVSLTDRAGWIETFGLTLAEAMSFGIPVIAPNIGAQTEYVIHGENGFLVDESDLESIRGFIDVLFSDPSKYSYFSNNAFETALNFRSEGLFKAINKELDFLG